MAFYSSGSSSSSSSRAQCSTLELEAVQALADLAGIGKTMEAEGGAHGISTDEDSEEEEEEIRWSKKWIDDESFLQSQGRNLEVPESSKSPVNEVTTYDFFEDIRREKETVAGFESAGKMANYPPEDFTTRRSIVNEKAYIEENSDELNLSISIPGSYTAVSFPGSSHTAVSFPGGSHHTDSFSGSHTAVSFPGSSKTADSFPAFAPMKCIRGKQEVSQADKETRRVRRILANRESARQTIRRRQIFRDELCKKIADLSLENKNMKVERELKIQEYLSLKNANKHLKEQVAKTIEKPPSIPHRGVESSPTTNERSCMPYFCASWPSVFRQHNISNNPSAVARPLYMPPCAWYYPFVQKYPVSFAQSSSAHGSRREEVQPSIFALCNNDKSHFKPGDSKGKSHQLIQMQSQQIQNEHIYYTNRWISIAETTEARRKRKELIKMKPKKHVQDETK